MAAPPLATFVEHSGERGVCGAAFDRESERILRIELEGGVWLKPGAAVAYRGDISFARRHTLEAHSVLDAAFRELTPLVRAVGTGRLYCSEHGQHVHPLRLAEETLFVSWDQLLAFEEQLAFDLMLVAKGVSFAAGGLVAVRLSGTGALALVTHGEVLTLPVSPGHPVSTDPHATVAWSSGLIPSLKTDLSWRSLFAHGGHEPFQMFFEGSGFVVVQPFENPRHVSVRRSSLERVLAGLKP
jgi:uncharacterized protein (AIM24 family)